MKKASIGVVRKAVTQRVSGNGPGAGRAFAAATVTGITAAVLTYKILRS